jgi:hypothetical protein
MRAHELANMLQHADPQSTLIGGDLLQAPDGTLFSLRESLKTMAGGDFHLVRVNRHHKHHHRHHRHHPKAAAAIVLVVSSVVINREENSMKVSLTWTTPAFRADGVTPLTLAEIATTNINRNGSILASVNAVDSSIAQGNSFDDTTPLTGADAYTVDTVTTDGLISDNSNEVDITIANANPAAAVTDLTGTLVADSAPTAATPALKRR